MNKHLTFSLARPCALAATTLCALAASNAAQAQSNVTVYGALGLDVIYATGVAKTGGGSASVVKIDDNAIVNSRIGIKGDEDLGGGLKALFDLESSVKPDTGAGGGGTYWNRNAFVGLSGGFGTAKLGHQWNPADDYMCSYFVCAFYAPFLLSGFGALSDYYDNSIKYTSPNMGGFEGGVMYVAGEQAGKHSAGQKFQTAVNYASGPFAVGAVVFAEKDPTSLGTNTMYALGASYDLGAAKLRAGLATAEVRYSYDATLKVNTTAGAFKAKLIDVGVDVPVTAAAAVSADYVSKDATSGTEPDVAFFRLRGTYALSKRTSLNANFVYIDNDKGGTVGFAGATEKGKSQSILSAGITHSF
jgi:predicted porin